MKKNHVIYYWNYRNEQAPCLETQYLWFHILQLHKYQNTNLSSADEGRQQTIPAFDYFFIINFQLICFLLPFYYHLNALSEEMLLLTYSLIDIMALELENTAGTRCFLAGSQSLRI